jgi:hypothetical protein
MDHQEAEKEARLVVVHRGQRKRLKAPAEIIFENGGTLKVRTTSARFALGLLHFAPNLCRSTALRVRLIAIFHCIRRFSHSVFRGLLDFFNCILCFLAHLLKDLGASLLYL